MTERERTFAMLERCFERQWEGLRSYHHLVPDPDRFLGPGYVLPIPDDVPMPQAHALWYVPSILTALISVKVD